MSIETKMTDLEIRVTRIKDRWHARLIVNGQVRDEMACDTQCDIRLICREMLRWYDKLGGTSKYADRSRHRLKEGQKIFPQGICGAKGKIWSFGNCIDKCKAMDD
jgi:hypothetical protein